MTGSGRPTRATAEGRSQNRRIEIVVHMMQWDDGEEYTRLGMVDDTFDLLGVPLPLVKLPITPGKNVTVICEVIAMNNLLRHYGYDGALKKQVTSGAFPVACAARNL